MARSASGTTTKENTQGGSGRFELYSRAIDAGSTSFNVLVIALVLAFVVYCFEQVLLAFAGTTTTANIVIGLAAQFKLDHIMSYVAGGGGVGYGIRQRHLRRQAIERLTNRTVQLEQMLDQRRSSSGLTPRGTTHPGDR